MHLAVLSSPESWYLRDLQRAAGSRHEITAIAFGEMACSLDEQALAFSAGPHDLSQFDAVLVRTMPPGTLEQVVFRMDLLGRLQQAGRPVVNPPRAIETAVDKYLSLAKLHAAALPVPPTVVCQTVDQAMDALVQLGGDVVVKPLFGGEGRGIARVNDEALALRAFKMLAQLGAVLYVQQFIAHDGYDLRLLIVGRRVLAMRRINPDDWRTNVSRGAHAEALTPTDEMVDLARRAAAAVGCPLAGVDLLPGPDGRLLVLEVNAVPGWRALARATETDVAAIVLEYLESLVNGQHE